MMNNLVKLKLLEYGISPLPENPVLAMAYVPYQNNTGKMYDPKQGIENGTMFVELNKPFQSDNGGEKGE